MSRYLRAAVISVLAMGISNATLAEELQVSTRDGARTAILVRGPQARAPTVIVLHGALMTAENTMSWYGFADAARKRGFASVYPRGINMLWNDGRDAAWASAADDVGFLKRLARDLVVRGTTDPSHLYLVGVSNAAGIRSTAAPITFRCFWAPAPSLSRPRIPSCRRSRS